ncbi:MAG: electron transporter RnfC [Caldilineaceae bacterium]|nr:electron transporter RnfC [Caldilineaceae bacterium]
MNEFKAGETLYAYIEATSGDLTPMLELTNFASKPLRSGNIQGLDSTATLQYTFPADAAGFRLQIASHGPGSPPTTGDYRLLLGADAEEVLSGQAEADGRAVARQPIDVSIGVKLEQIVDVDQQLEFFTGAASLRMEWNDPAWAFNPEDCNCDFKTFEGGAITSFVTSEGRRWPEFTIHNQQGNRWRQNEVLVVFSNGDAIYFERFTTNFQVDFDFEQFPFDTQTFVIRAESLFPNEYFIYTDHEDFSGISPDHGEDEFILSDATVEISSVPNSGGNLASRYTFSFEGPRHLSYYVFQIFVPILLIILVSWFTFFLKDYVRRIEVASGNLLLFIAFSFSLSDNYPRLGYLTFLDAVMAIMFVVNALVVVYNVWLRRMEMNEQVELVERIDNIMDWVYPLMYVLLLIILIWWFF